MQEHLHFLLVLHIVEVSNENIVFCIFALQTVAQSTMFGNSPLNSRLTPFLSSHVFSSATRSHAIGEDRKWFQAFTLK